MAHNEDALRVVRQEVQNPPALLKVVLGVGAQAPDEVRELDAITHKEDLQEAALLSGPIMQRVETKQPFEHQDATQNCAAAF